MTKPLIMGALMGVLMLGMLHDQIMAGEFRSGAAAAAFIGAHLAVLLAASAATLFFPGMRRFVARHRPAPLHVATMGAGAIGSVALVHLVAHGGPI